MNEIEWSATFKRDFVREFRADRRIVGLLIPVVADLLRGVRLDPKHRDHALTGDWKSCRDCHIKPDLVLIYSFPAPGKLRLERLGSHSELSL